MSKEKKDQQVRFLALRSKTTGAWLVPPELKPRLIEEAAEKGWTMNDVAVSILARHYKVKVDLGGPRRGQASADNDQAIIIRHMPIELDAKIAYAARRSTRSVSSEIAYVLSAHYGLRMPAPQPAPPRRPRRPRASRATA